MNSGDLDKRVELQNRSETSNQAGERIKGSWTTFSSDVNASIRPVNAKEQLRAQTMQLEQEITHTIRIRKSSKTTSLTGESRVLYGSRAFEIVGIIEVMEQGFDLEILAVEVKQ